MNSLPLEIVEPQKIYLYNSVVGKFRKASFKANGSTFSFKFLTPQSEYQATSFLKVRLSDHIIWLSLKEFPSLSFFSKKYEGIDLKELPAELQPIVLESAYEKTLEMIEESIGVVITVEEITTEQPSELPEEKLYFKVASKKKSFELPGCIYLDIAALEFLSALLERGEVEPNNRFNYISMPMHVAIGRETISLSKFKDLDINDIIFLSNGDFIENGICDVVIADYFRYKATLKQRTVTLTDTMEKESTGEEPLESMEVLEESLGEEVQEDTLEQPMEGFDELPVHLIFEVGQKKVPLADLRSMKAGYTFELPNPAKTPVNIRANGRLIGSGELLQIGDRVGVRVTKFKEKSS